MHSKQKSYMYECGGFQRLVQLKYHCNITHFGSGDSIPIERSMASETDATHQELKTFLSKYGFRPPRSLSLGKRIRGNCKLSLLCQGYASANVGTVKKVDKFLAHVRQRCKISRSTLVWLLQIRKRKILMTSTFQKVLITTLQSYKKKKFGILPTKKELQMLPTDRKRSLKPIMAGRIPLSNQCVVDFLYQATLDVVYILKTLLGDGKFDSKHQIGPGCQGEVLLLWGSHLGAVRQQAFLAHDVDVDCGVFIPSTCNYSDIRDTMIKRLEAMGYQCKVHKRLLNGEQHVKIGPPKAYNIREHMEHYQASKIANPHLNRPRLMNLTKRKRKQGSFKGMRFLGYNVVDVTFYTVKPTGHLHLSDAKCKKIEFDKVFPSKFAHFGPYIFAIPRTTDLLTAEYGNDCLREPKLKRNKNQFIHIDSEIRRASWPSTTLPREYDFRYLKLE